MPVPKTLSRPGPARAGPGKGTAACRRPAAAAAADSAAPASRAGRLLARPDNRGFNKASEFLQVQVQAQ